MTLNFDFKGIISGEVKELVNFVEEKFRSYTGQARGVAVKGLMEHLNFALTSQRIPLNFLIFNLEQTYWQRLENVHFFHTIDFDGTKFAVWIFESGEFENTGQGTHANWGMGGYKLGSMKSSGEQVTGGLMGRHVTFFKPIL